MTKRPTLAGKRKKPRGKPIATRTLAAKPETSTQRQPKIDSARAAAPKSEPKPKAGRSSDASASRNRAFADAFLTNGHNATAAAIAAGCPPTGARNAGSRFLQQAEVQTILGARAVQIAERAGLNSERWGDALNSLCFGTVGDLFDADGRPMPVHLMPRHVQAMIKSIKVTKDGEGGEETTYQLWDKVGALGIAARHLGLFEKDNAQQSDITVRVELVG